jgi:hypothetical protein
MFHSYTLNQDHQLHDRNYTPERQNLPRRDTEKHGEYFSNSVQIREKSVVK